MTPERAFLTEIMTALSRRGFRVFRNNVGVGWVGRLLSNRGHTVVLSGARPLHAGLCTGSSDLIGWKSVTITPEMVGQQVAVFVAIEAKTGRVRTTDEQANFIEQVRKAGGIAAVVRSIGEATSLDWF